jgi:polysaccharide pyruvyl transferase WcaK-like protein
MKIAIFNVKYSPNLGDGLLSECLERELTAAAPVLTVNSVDLAGRTGFSSGGRYRGVALTILEALPRLLRQFATTLILGVLITLSLRPKFRAALADADAVVVGGGNLFADVDLNFPSKINAALGAAGKRRLPAAVFGVGVTRNWSPKGEALFSNALRDVDLVDVTVRDERSQTIWTDLLVPFGVRGANIARDPGLLASRHYAAAERSLDGRSIGFCITDPVALRYHTGRTDSVVDVGRWYGAVIGALAQASYRVTLFTNGSPEDRTFLDANAAGWCAIAPVAIRQMPAFQDPAALAHFISSCDGLIAHRMHACIAAHSFGIPSIGLRWDVKLDSFFELVGRASYMADLKTLPPDQIVALLDRAITEGIDRPALDALIAAGREDVARLARILLEAARKGD